MLPVANVANSQLGVANDQLGIGNWNWQYFHIGNILKSLFCFLMPALVAHAEPGYTNHAGNVVSGWPVKLTATQVVLSEGTTQTTNHYPQTTNHYPLSIFPESERRRIAADFGQPRVPVAVKRAIAGAEKAMARSRKRAEKGLCTKEDSEAFCAKSEAALKSYLDKQVKEGVITHAERKALGHAY